MSNLGYNRGIYSWFIQDLLADTIGLANVCNVLNLNEVYQEIPVANLNSELVNAIQTLQSKTSNTISISQLVGDPSWYKDATEPKAQIDALVTFNKGVGASCPINKIIYDIEAWDIESIDWEEKYLTTIKDVYSYAKSNNINMGLVIPYWITTVNITNFYKEVIDNCDEIMVMNYNRNTYATTMDSMITYAKTNNKIIYSLAEFQPPNESIADNITYFNIGLYTLTQNWLVLQNKYNYEYLSFAYDDYTALRSLLTNAVVLQFN